MNGSGHSIAKVRSVLFHGIRALETHFVGIFKLLQELASVLLSSELRKFLVLAFSSQIGVVSAF